MEKTKSKRLCRVRLPVSFSKNSFTNNFAIGFVMSTKLFRISGIALCAVVMFSAAQFSTTGAAPEDSESAAPEGRQGTQLDFKDDNTAKRLREGTQITDVIGYFRQDGDGATFVADSGREFIGLQNLNLERVVRTLKSTDETKRLRWSVSGLVTEFMNRNFILISRSVYKSTVLPTAPEQVSN